MKAITHIFVTEKQVQKSVDAQIEDIRFEVYQEAVQDITAQTLATVLVTLEQCYGWKGERLRKFVECIHDTEDLMVKPSPLHHRFTHLDNLKHIKDKYNIDLRKEFPAHAERKKGNR